MRKNAVTANTYEICAQREERYKKTNADNFDFSVVLLYAFPYDHDNKLFLESFYAIPFKCKPHWPSNIACATTVFVNLTGVTICHPADHHRHLPSIGPLLGDYSPTLPEVTNPGVSQPDTVTDIRVCSSNKYGEQPPAAIHVRLPGNLIWQTFSSLSANRVLPHGDSSMLK